MDPEHTNARLTGRRYRMTGARDHPPLPPIISADWLIERFGRFDSERIQLIDTSWNMTNDNRPHHDVFLDEHIPGAVHFDVNVIAAPSRGPPHRMMPDPALFARLVGQVGIDPEATLIFYDNAGLYTAARAWWMFRGSGHVRSAVLDGGLPAWKAAGGKIEKGVERVLVPTRWPTPNTRPIVRTWQDVLANITSGNEQLIDARPPEQYNGDTSFRYPGVRPGHIPGSVNLSQRNLRNPNHVFKGIGEMRTVFADHGIDLARPIIASCGSGITACIIALACEVIGQGQVAIYDGSWEEWGSRPDLPALLG